MTYVIINRTRYAFLLGIMALFTLFSCQENTLAELQEDVPELEDAVTESVAPNRYIVEFKDEFIAPSSSRSKVFTDRAAKMAFSQEREKVTVTKINKFLDNANIERSLINRTYTAIIAGFAGELTKEQVEALKADPNVKSIEADRIVELDLPKSNSRVTMETPEGLRADYVDCAITNANGSADGSASGKWIWIVDTGIDYDHPDLNVQTSATFTKTFYGANAEDDNGHGTHCAGIAAAKSNGFGVLGVSAGATVVPVKVLDNTGSGWTADIIDGLDHVSMYDIAGDVVNLSLGGYRGTNCENTTPYSNTIVGLGGAGTFVAIAAGNSNNNASLYQPACVNGNNIFTVAAMDCDKSFAAYSNYGIPPVDYIATGTQVWSTWVGGGYKNISGTSMATPVVAGILHQRQAAPAFGGWVFGHSQWYRIAHR